ncbi:NAD(P)-dependent oxidoreductase [Mucilaginibacter galii]|uniref:N-acetyl-alpha-D-glucosaminyl-diphospho-ditrans, octacis-undecaprenol 4-epimerase n=1 Tax=Mucilaginibacter galii TaxID=2005073 RepID=A0A917N209_9SPHI|nr:NAD(P)-dependent oxidoreductase [Mucilaginibacter galii]GGI51456.1 N-acetyl-alpha-D-glucosaminyl-diphospho-ditrans, octacis-undecaprenol 4-epimerase [Mucilaginibacter galii]
MNYLIFGGAGFIGSHLTKYISAQQINGNVLSYDIAAKAHNEFTYLDVRKPISIDLPDLSGSVIYNLAAVHTTPGHADKEYFETNILGAENICNFARQNHINTIIFTSSIAPYGPSEDLKSETTMPMPNTPYGISKLTAEYIHKVWQAEDPANRKLFIVRPGVVFGKQEGGNFTRLYQSMKKGFFFYPGRKDTTKAAVYVKDVVRILYEASANNTSKGVDTYNLTYYPAPTIQEICEIMAEVTKVNKPQILVPAPLLKLAASTLYYTGSIIGKKINGIHPDRVKKLMISTNISGKKLSESQFHLKYSLREAIDDWFNDCNKKELI